MSYPKPSSKSLFLDALEIESDSDRMAFLEKACGEDSQLREEIESLLDAHRDPPDVVRQVDEHPRGTVPQIAEGPGTQIGPYQLLEQLGEGGFGVVYLADQQQPVKRRVALKIIKPGMDNREVLARFDAERQTLALMDHPNIARVLDADTTDSGRPYFVMELVQGMAITEYCDEHQLTPRERLELFVPVCHAVQHAHQKGIIHRDIKPSNVLVAEYDGRAVPRIIDFGVAKATQRHPTEKTTFTKSGQLVGTVEYMSPEQANLNELDIDTRSDIYSLGVLLYELLTGQTPIDRGRLRSAAFDELLRIIREEEPPKPSTRITTLGETAGTVFAQRQTEPRKLGHLLRGDLDWIVMKALEKERGRRYETANGFAADIERYLDDEPVLACPPSPLYRIRKFARRNKAIMTTVGLVAASLLLATVTLAISSLQLAHERNVTEDAKESERRQREQVSKLAQQLELQLYDAEMAKAHAAVLHHDFEQASRILKKWMPQPGAEDHRSFEWYHLWRTCQGALDVPTIKLGKTAPQNEIFLTCGRYSPDGRYLALADEYGNVSVHDAKSLTLLWDFIHERPSPGLLRARKDTEVHESFVNDLVFTLDTELLFSAGHDRTIKVWRVSTGELLQTETFFESDLAVSSLAISPNGQTLAAGFGHQDQDSKAPIHISLRKLDRAGHLVGHEESPGGPLRGLTGRVHSITFSRDGHFLAACSQDSRIQIFRLDDGQPLPPLEGHSGTVREVTFSPDDENLLASASYENSVTDQGGGEIKLWDIEKGSEIATLRRNAWTRCLDFTPDGSQLAAGDHDGMVRVWDVESHALRREFPAHGMQVNDIAFSPRVESLLTVSHDRTAKIWNQSGDSDDGPTRITGHGAGMLRLAVSHDSRRLLSAGFDGIAKLWEAETGQLITSVKEARRMEILMAAEFSPGGKSVAIAGGSWPARSDVPLEVLVWDVASGEAKTLFSGTHSKAIGSAIFGVAFSPKGHRVAAGIGEEIRIWNVSDGQIWKVLRSGFVGDLAWCRKTDRIAALSWDPTAGIRLWDGATGEKLPSILPTVHTPKDVSALFRLAFSPDGQTLAVGTAGGKILLFDVDKCRFLKRLKGHTDWVWDVAFSPDGRRLASASADRTVKLWNLETETALLTFREPSNPVQAVRFSPNGRALFAPANHVENSVIHVWRAARPDEVHNP